MSNRPQLQEWPARAVVTAGMPYGNKPLHFGHIAGVFVPADCYARFLRDRIGADNVRFISGTDCFGSPIDEGYRKLVEAGEFDGSIAEYVQRNHDAQASTLKAYDISLDIYEGSGIGHAGECQQEVSENLIRRLHENGWLHRRSTLQFYDAEAGIYLNGRQVVGRCPVQGCKSERGYADECSLGHSYAPEELIAPKSTVTGAVPEMRPVDNWYFDLPAFRDFLRAHVQELQADPNIRAIVPQTCAEFLGAPVIYVKNDDRDPFESVAADLPAHVVREAEKGKASFEVEFDDIDARDEARDVLRRAGLRFRTGKALVPFRITGNIEWGVKAPVIDGVEGLTVWCWPESLWAPISFTIAANDARGLPSDSWRDFWCSEDAEVYQFIGQDNLYFYGVVQPALWQALQPGEIFSHDSTDRPLRQTRLIANYHVLLGNKKASSSSAVKPPTADELLQHYTTAQLRAHFLALGLGQKSVGFKPKAFDPDESVRNDARVADPALKESKLLSNVFNRLARSVLYEAKRNFGCHVPLCNPTPAVVERAQQALADYDRTMKKAELHSIMSLADEFIRYSNKVWADGISAAEGAEDADARAQVLADAAYLLWICTLIMHPVVPAGCEDICDKLQFDPLAFFSWNHDFATLAELDGEAAADGHAVQELPARYDFF
ncbi:MAG TPA: methionine--tRNA ligase [Eggerthellaceae bacterium]|nr:methionine--tRNA ligase [Eggerthellaceae bacterium]